MKKLDVYYRALLKYREQTQQNKECASDSRAVIKANPEQDKIVLTRKHCIIEEDWVDAIEEGLKYIAKAIAEERQFIYSNGEIVPIEKVKHVSKDSVVHLAKHSNLITREIPGKDIIPDQLYTVEKLNDYAVYENKFLYMLLCYLRDFITIRYNKILELSNTYNGTMSLNKVVKTANRTIKYKLDLAETKRDDDYLKETNQAKDIINRIDLLLKTVLSFFSTPLMQIVSKAPMIKPPITKTNVLKMNNNFKQALNLYGYVVAYDGDGYRVETEIKEISPFTEIIAEEMSETVLLSSFIAYEHALGIESTLKHAYDLEEQRRKEQSLKEFQEKLEAARLRVQKSEMSMEEYILMLEKYIRTLEKKAKELDKVKKELEESQAILEQYKIDNEQLQNNLQQAINDLEAEKQRYINDMAALKLAHEEELRNLVTEYDNKIAELLSSHQAEIAALREEHQTEIDAMRESHQTEIEQLNERHEEALSAKENEIASLNERNAVQKAQHQAYVLSLQAEHAQQIQALTATNKQIAEQLEEEIKQRRFLKAQHLALKKEMGKLTQKDEHITELAFDDLQLTFEQFKAFYREEWKKAKRHIRLDIFSKIFKRKKSDQDPTQTTDAPLQQAQPQSADEQITTSVPPTEQSAPTETPVIIKENSAPTRVDETQTPSVQDETVITAQTQPKETAEAVAETAETEEQTPSAAEEQASQEMQE